ncbi:hypothetical protein E2C01_078023 [Portunus trituberculatus]|uniref:Uncharacterized protein n=1 Tax=Portunus trituberculatus TaxID=210409 RepID=A0A5B7INU0_PORTR|nr:hypothetical protein [Portunus trituberculatus]
MMKKKIITRTTTRKKKRTARKKGNKAITKEERRERASKRARLPGRRQLRRRQREKLREAESDGGGGGGGGGGGRGGGGEIKDGNERKARGDSGTRQLYNYRAKLTGGARRDSGGQQERKAQGTEMERREMRQKRFALCLFLTVTIFRGHKNHKPGCEEFLLLVV